MALNPAIPWQPNVAAPYRATMFITSGRWEITESHWLPGGTVPASDILPKAVVLATARRAFLPSTCNLTEVRCSQENVYRDSSIDTSMQYTSGSLASTWDSPSDCMRMRLEATSLNRKTLYLGFVPSVVISNDLYLPNASTAYDQGVQDYMNILAGSAGPPPILSQGWGYPVVVGDQNPGGTPRSQILRVVLTAGSPSMDVTVANLGTIVDGSVVRIGKVPLLALRFGINGLFQVASLNGNVLSVALPFPSPVTFSGPVQGYCKQVYKVFAAYTKWVFLNGGDRKRGGRTFLPAGRSKRSHLLGS